MLAPPQGYPWTSVTGRPQIASAALAVSYATTSTTPVSAGFGTTMTAPPTGKVKLDMACIVDPAPTQSVTVYQGAAIPAAGSAPASGDTPVYAYTGRGGGSNDTWSGGCHMVISGLTPRQTYAWYFAVNTGGTGTVTLIGDGNQSTLCIETLP